MILILYARPATKPYQVTPNNLHNKSIIVHTFSSGCEEPQLFYDVLFYTCRKPSTDQALGIMGPSIRITLRGFPHQTSDSVTDVGLFNCKKDVTGTWTCYVSKSDILIPGIGQGRLDRGSVIIRGDAISVGRGLPNQLGFTAISLSPGDHSVEIDWK